MRRFATLALAAALAVAITRSGPLTFRAPESIVSNSRERADGREILLLRQVEPFLPAGSTVALVPRDPAFARYDYLIALGQLALQQVVSARSLSSSAGGLVPPRFIATAAPEFSDPRYRKLRSFPEGSLFERIP